MIPKPVADADLPASEQRVKWDYGDAKDLLADKKFKEALEIFAALKAKDFDEVAAELTDADQQAAFKKVVIAPLKSDPKKVISDVINWKLSIGATAKTP